jgi:pyruvate carboxylase
LLQLPAAAAACASEALRAFGRGDVYAEELIEGARHIEVQCVGDGTGRVICLGERECSLQRRQQKIVEMSPSPSLSPPMREQLQGKPCLLLFRPSLSHCALQLQHFVSCPPTPPTPPSPPSAPSNFS